MKVLVTGSSGFLGRHLVPRLQARRYDLILPRSREMDLMVFPQVEAYLTSHRPDVVVHSAAYYGGIGINQAEPANLFFRNTVMTANLFEAAARAGLSLRFLPDGSSRLEPEAAGADAVLGGLLATVTGAMAEGTWERLKACRSDACRWAFYDHAKNRSRTWCSMAVCGNRQKARAYRQRSGSR